MEYIVSARKYRPMTFDSVIGQSTIATTLKNAVKSGKLAHAYLFSGPRGVGKTTCARIFAKAINCFNPTDDGEACGQCESCQSFNEQRSLNIFELDAASNNGIEHIKSLIEQTRVPPQVGKYKVFIIDEVHQLSTAAFNAFLKTLEEPPAHVIFILATTEKQKLLPTIISRCQLYDFERMRVSDMVAHLKHVAEQEGYRYEEEALHLIAEKADGGMRDALSIFDQTASYCQGNITYEKVVEDLNVLDADNYFRLIDLALEGKVADMMVLFDSVLNKGFDGGQVIAGLASHVRYVMLAREEATSHLIDKSESLRQRYHQQAQRCQPRFLFNALRILNDCDLNYRQSGHKRLLAELALIEVAQLTQGEDDPPGGRRPTQILKPIFNTEEQSKENGGITATTNYAPASAATPPSDAPAATEPAMPQSATATTPVVEPQSVATTHQPNPQTVTSRQVLSFKSLQQAQEAAIEEEELPATDEQAAFTQEMLSEQWMAMCERMAKSQPGLAVRLKNVSPQLTPPASVMLLLPNEDLARQVRNIEKRILKTLVNNLHNNTITLCLQVDPAAFGTSVLTDQEFLVKLKQDYPLFRKMCDQLQLEQV